MVERSKRLVGPWKLIKAYKMDIYKYPDDMIPYIRFFKGRTLVKKFKLTTAARGAIVLTMASFGIPNMEVKLFLDGIYRTFAA